MSTHSFVAGVFVAAFIFSFASVAFSAHPLVTDDTGTQGRKKVEVEFAAEYEHGEEETAKTVANELYLSTQLSYGITDTLDLILGTQYEFARIRDTESQSLSKFSELSNVLVGFKWRFYEREGLSFGVKGGVSFITGKEERAEAGNREYSLVFITTKEAAPWAFHFNIGYERNENESGNRKDLWGVSFAAERELTKRLRAVGDIGIKTNPDPSSSTPPAYALGGLIYSLSKTIDIDCGAKVGLTRPEVDYALLSGITFRF